MLAVLSLRAEMALKPCPGPAQGSLSVSTLDSGLLGTFTYGLCTLSFSNQGLAQSRHLVVLLSVRRGALPGIHFRIVTAAYSVPSTLLDGARAWWLLTSAQQASESHSHTDSCVWCYPYFTDQESKAQRR